MLNDDTAVNDPLLQMQDSASIEGRWVHSATGGEYLALQKCQMKVAGNWVEGVIYVAEGLWLEDGRKPVYCRGLGDFMANFTRV